MSVLDVHIVRTPIAGRITQSVYMPGKFLNAELDKASDENERQAFVIETGNTEKLGLVLIAGLIARRIVTFVGEGASVTAGERIGLIRFGSRVDVYLPAGAKVLPYRSRQQGLMISPQKRVTAVTPVVMMIR